MWVLRREFWVSYFVWLVHLPPLLIPVFTAELCGFFPLVPLVICAGTEPGSASLPPCTPSCPQPLDPAEASLDSSHFIFCDVQLLRGTLSPHCFACSLASGFWFPPFFFFLFLWLLWSAQRAADSPWKTQQTFHTDHLLAFTILSCATFVFIGDTWETRTFRLWLICLCCFQTACRSGPTCSCCSRGQLEQHFCSSSPAF